MAHSRQTLIQMLLMCSRTIRLTRCKPGAGTIWWPQCVHNTRPRVCAFVCFSLEKFQEIKLPMDCRFDLMSLSHNLSRSIHTSVGRKTSARWRQGARTCCNTSALHCLHVVYWYCTHVHNAAYIMLWLACCRYPTLAGHPIAIVGNVTVDLFVGTVRFFARQRKKDISISASGSPSHREGCRELSPKPFYLKSSDRSAYYACTHRTARTQISSPSWLISGRMERVC